MSDDDPVTESAKAVQEVAKTASKALETGDKVGSFVGKYVSGPFEQVAGMIEDRLRFTRWERRVRLVQRALEIADETGISLSPDRIPLNVAAPLMLEGSMEEDDELQDLYASLLVNGANEGAETQVRRMHVEILSQLGPLEIRILNALYACRDDLETREGWVATYALPDRVISTKAIQERENEVGKMQPPSQKLSVAAGNLVRVGCVFVSAMGGGLHQTNWISISALGIEFIEACTATKCS